MTGRHRGPTMSAIDVAKLAFAGAIIGGGSLALAGQASAATGGEWDRLAHSAPPQTWALDVPLAPAPDDPPLPPAPPPVTPAPAAGGPPPVPEVPADQQVHGLGQLGYLRQIWHEVHDHPDDVIGGLTPGADPDAPPGAPTGSQQVLPPGAPPLPPGEQPLPPDQQPHPLHAVPPPS
jgi:hypothetical protein